MSIKIYTLQSALGFELMHDLDEKGIPYEVCEPTTTWSVLNKIKSLPVLEVDGKLLDYRKAKKWIRKR